MLGHCNQLVHTCFNCSLGILSVICNCWPWLSVVPFKFVTSSIAKRRFIINFPVTAFILSLLFFFFFFLSFTFIKVKMKQNSSLLVIATLKCVQGAIQLCVESCNSAEKLALYLVDGVLPHLEDTRKCLLGTTGKPSFKLWSLSKSRS